MPPVDDTEGAVVVADIAGVLGASLRVGNVAGVLGMVHDMDVGVLPCWTVGTGVVGPHAGGVAIEVSV